MRSNNHKMDEEMVWIVESKYKTIIRKKGIDSKFAIKIKKIMSCNSECNSEILVNVDVRYYLRNH